MVRIFLSAGHGAGDPGAMAGDTTEKEELIETRDAVIKEMRSRGKTIDLQKFKVSVSWDMLLGRWS
jgi:N-acetylmuramoyl-L-alanine amidase